MITLNILRTRETDYEIDVDVADVVAAIGEAGIGMPAPGQHADETDESYFDRLADMPGFDTVLAILVGKAEMDPTVQEDPEVSEEITWTMTDWSGEE